MNFLLYYCFICVFMDFNDNEAPNRAPIIQSMVIVANGNRTSIQFYGTEDKPIRNQ